MDAFYIDFINLMLYNNTKYNKKTEVKALEIPIRYFVINRATPVMHIYGFCQQTKPRAVPIRLFDKVEDLEKHTGRQLALCKACRKELEQLK